MHISTCECLDLATQDIMNWTDTGNRIGNSDTTDSIVIGDMICWNDI